MTCAACQAEHPERTFLRELWPQPGQDARAREAGRLALRAGELDGALKVLRPEIAADPEMTRRFQSEIKLARKVSHRNVCRIHEYGQDGALAYISMELISGTDLKAPPRAALTRATRRRPR